MTRKLPTFNEIVTKVILEQYFNQKLEFSDAPDLITENRKGIEVVEALPEKEQEAVYVYAKKVNNETVNSYKCPKGWKANEFGLIHEAIGIEALPIYSSLVKCAISKKAIKKQNYSVSTDSLFITTICPGLTEEQVVPYCTDLLKNWFDNFETYYIYFEDEGSVLKITKDNYKLVHIDSALISQKSTLLYNSIYKNESD